MPRRTAVPAVAASILAVLVAGAAPAQAAAAPDAMTIVKKMDRRPYVYLANPVAEGPDVVVTGGLCVRFAELGCEQMVSTKDASIMVFGTAADADMWEGHADDTARAVGRMVVSFGAPARVRKGLRDNYVRAVRAFRKANPEVKNDPERAVEHLTARGLRMRDPQLEDERGERPGKASKIPGAVDMVATDQADVIVFGTKADAKAYVGNADDVAVRDGRVVLSFGNPPRVIKSGRAEYERVLGVVLDRMRDRAAG
jgi:hypothetical protein